MSLRLHKACLLGAIFLFSAAFEAAGQFQVVEPLGKADLVYSRSDSLGCDLISGFLGSDPCHVGIFVSGSTVIEAIDDEGDSVRSTSLSEFESRGTPPNGFRGSKTTLSSPTSAQRDTIAAYMAAKNARLTYYDDNHFNQKGGYAGGCSNGTPSCWDGFDYFNEFDCVGLAERAYEYAGLNPTPSSLEGFLLPEEQYQSSSLTYPSTTLSNNTTQSSTVKSAFWRFFNLNVPSGMTSLRVTVSNGSGDVDLYVRRSFFPTPTVFDCSSTSSSGNEECTISNPSSGAWGIGVYGYGSGTLSFSVKALYSPPAPTVNWVVAPPSQMIAGSQHQVSWTASGSYDHVNVHWNPVDPTASGCCTGPGNTTNSSTLSPSSSPLTLTAPSFHENGAPITSSTTVKYVVHVRNDATQAFDYSSVVSVTVLPPCSFTLSPPNQSFGSSGGSGSFSVLTQSGCSWSAGTSANWISIISGSGSGNGTVSFNVGSNSSTNSRSGTITVGGQTFTVNQSGLSCSYSLSPTSQSFGSGGGAGSFSVLTQSGCSWSASTSASWISITSGSGSGNGTVSFNVGSNPSNSSRSGTITVGGQTFTVNQSGLSCSYSLSPTSQSFGSGGGSGSFSVLTQSGCSWSASTSASWVSITSGSGSGNGTVSFDVSSNPSNSSRSGTITVGGQTFTVNQSGLSCSYSLSPTSQSFGSGGGSGSFSVLTQGGCSWSASTSASWISITSGSGSGNGTVSFDVSSNPSNSSRSDTITVAGQTFSVGQAGTTLSASTPAADFDGDGTADWVIYRHGAWLYFGPCAHLLNQEGPALSPSCSACVATVCNTDAFCCESFWDVYCVDEARNWCS